MTRLHDDPHTFTGNMLPLLTDAHPNEEVPMPGTRRIVVGCDDAGFDHTTTEGEEH
jgi:hypothetical protein